MFLRKFVLIYILFIFTSFVKSENSFSPIFEEESTSLENRIVQLYLHDADSAYTETIAREGTSLLNYEVLGWDSAHYLSAVEVHYDCSPAWTEQPRPVSIFSKDGASIYVSDSPDFNTFLAIDAAADSDTTQVYNLVPQKVYWYKVLSDSLSVIRDGVFKTFGRVRMVACPRVLNVRDIGGWSCSGGRIAYGKIFRGATLDGHLSINDSIPNTTGMVQSEDISILKDLLNVGSELDFRASAESDYMQSPLGSDVIYNRYHHLAYLNLVGADPSSYLFGKYGSVTKAVKRMYEAISTGKSVYVHCTWGADRTGTFLALLEAYCGVSEQDIVKDWELTSFSSFDSKRFIDSPNTDLRGVFQYLYDNYGGEEGKTLQQQVSQWFSKKVFSYSSSEKKKYLDGLKSLLIESVGSTPVLVEDCGSYEDVCYYSVSRDSTNFCQGNDYSKLGSEDGIATAHDAFYTTDYIGCAGLKYLYLNSYSDVVASFYDQNANFLGCVSNQNMQPDMVLLRDSQYSISFANAAFVRFNVPKNAGWKAVLSAKALLSQ